MEAPLRDPWAFLFRERNLTTAAGQEGKKGKKKLKKEKKWAEKKKKKNWYDDERNKGKKIRGKNGEKTKERPSSIAHAPIYNADVLWCWLTSSDCPVRPLNSFFAFFPGSLTPHNRHGFPIRRRKTSFLPFSFFFLLYNFATNVCFVFFPSRNFDDTWPFERCALLADIQSTLSILPSPICTYVQLSNLLACCVK